jgi:YD repeat-containing protein
VSLPTGPGDYTDTTTNPDGTQTVDVYVDDLLTQKQQLGTDGSLIDLTNYSYNAMRELISQSDFSGSETFSYWADGSQKTGQLQSKTYADGTQDIYKYNDNGQLANVFEPGVTGSLRA